MYSLPRPWHLDRWQDVAQREGAQWRRKHEGGATFGIHCLDVGTEIVSEISHNVKMAIAGRNHKCGATLAPRSLARCPTAAAEIQELVAEDRDEAQGLDIAAGAEEAEDAEVDGADTDGRELPEACSQDEVAPEP